MIGTKSKKIVKLVITQSNRNSVIAKQMRTDMVQANLPVCNTHISARVAFAESALASSTPSFLQPTSKAALEIYPEALELLKQAISKNPKVIRIWAKEEPIFTKLHNNDQFKKLVKL